jgi:hypothetical protein
MSRHEAECADCGAYAKRARRAEGLIRAALNLEPQVGRGPAALGHVDDRRGRRPTLVSSFAAALVAAVAIWFAFGAASPRTTEELATEILDHWDHEPSSLVASGVTVTDSVLSLALDGKATLDRAGVGPVTYARVCRVAGQWMPHLVVQTPRGPAMILLVPEAELAGPVLLALPALGVTGLLQPHGKGAIVVIGDGLGDLAPVEQSLAAAVDWTI